MFHILNLFRKYVKFMQKRLQIELWDFKRYRRYNPNKMFLTVHICYKLLKPLEIVCYKILSIVNKLKTSYSNAVIFIEN